MNDTITIDVGTPIYYIYALNLCKADSIYVAGTSNTGNTTISWIYGN